MFALLDQLISNRKWDIRKIWICFPVPVLYFSFNVIYWAAGGEVNGRTRHCMKTTLTLESGNNYIYPVLDWGADPGGAVLYLFIGFVVLPLIYALFWLLTLLRDKVHTRLFRSASSAQGQENIAFSERP